MIINNDCLIALKELPENSVDAIVTDPPYGLSFMGKKWDYDVPSTEIWKECLRVLKPGGYLLAFAGTRTQHRMAVRIEDAGFEIRDMIAWIYGSGFPKSLNIGKAVDKLQGNEREVVGKSPHFDKYNSENYVKDNAVEYAGRKTKEEVGYLTKGTSEWEGWGTALKPALEPITVARKPLSENTVAENCLKWGVGGINIDGSRVEATGKDLEQLNSEWDREWSVDYSDYAEKVGGTAGFNMDKAKVENKGITGRFPANLIHDGSDEVLGLFPSPHGAGNKRGSGEVKHGEHSSLFGIDGHESNGMRFGDSGSAARFFYCAKASKSERNRGLDGTLTVKYTGTIWKEENIVAAQLLKKVISGMAQMSFSTGESGESLMVQFPKGSSFITETIINKIMTSQILNSLTLSLTNEYTQDANLEVELGGNLVENVANLKAWILTITKDNLGLALGANHVALEMLSQISKKENWKEATNFHSTVKPIALMEYLVKLVSKEGHTVLDPFLGSGTTAIACKNLNRNCIGIERDAEYVKISEARISAVK